MGITIQLNHDYVSSLGPLGLFGGKAVLRLQSLVLTLIVERILSAAILEAWVV